MKSFHHVNFGNQNSLYLIFDSLDGYIEENNGMKCLVFASTDENKEALKSTQNIGMKWKIKLKQ